MISVIFPVVFPVFALAALGYWWARTDRPFDTAVVSALVTNIGTPALIIDSLLRVELSHSALFEMMLAVAIIHAVFIAVGWILVKAAGQPVTAFLPGVVFGNTGNMGLPLCLFAFGEDGLALAVAYFVTYSILLFTVGSQLAAGKASLRDFLRTPMVWAIAIALALVLTDTALPVALSNTVGLLGGMTIPLMLLALGVSLARLRVASLGRATYFSLARLGLGFATGWGVATLMGLEGLTFGVVVVQSAMPVAVFNYLFAARYDNRPEEVAGTVVVSTLLSFITLPLILGMVMV